LRGGDKKGLHYCTEAGDCGMVPVAGASGRTKTSGGLALFHFNYSYFCP